MDRKVEIQKFLTKSGKINSRISPEKYQYLVDDYRKDAPWISDLKDILWCEKTGSYSQPVCRFCGKQAIYQRVVHSYRNYCSDCLNKHFSEERSKNGTWNKGLTKDTDDRVRENAKGIRKFRKTHELSEAQKSVVDRMIVISKARSKSEKPKKKELKKSSIKLISTDKEIILPDLPDSGDRFQVLLNTYKGYTSNLKFNDLLMPFIWRIFYKKEIELWNDSNIRTKLIQNRISYLHKSESELTDLDILRGFTISGIHKGFSSFSPMVIKNFIKDYTISSIYDPCGGWGHRLLGAWNVEYWYNDFNSELVDAIRKVFCYYDNGSAKKYFSCNDASTFIPNRTFDAVFTCPPYYDTEDYDFEGDSKNLVQGYQQWLDIWWRGVVQRGKEVAPIFAYVISEKFAEDMNRIVEEEGFTLIGTHQTSIARKNHLSINAKEFLFVFSKQLTQV